jgi:UDP-GlcNAc3NAcA epimerase
MILTVLGARPQFVKAAVVSRALAECGVGEQLVHTGQHYDDRMSGVFWRELGLPGVAINLAVGSARHGAQTGQMMEKLEEYILTSPGVFRGVLVYGDTNSTLAGALVAAKLGLPLFHVEAGLRSFDRAMPEEVNRVVTDHLSAHLYCPSDQARLQLQREGIVDGVEVVGDVMLDAFRIFQPVAVASEARIDWGGGSRARAILTVHRPSNTDDGGFLGALLRELGRLPVDVLWPVHPRLRPRLAELHIPENVRVEAPLSYVEMLGALDRTDLVVTDSGGLQKEAYWARRRCITLRSQTEWTETVSSGWNILVGNDLGALATAFQARSPAEWPGLYGDGSAAHRIASSIRDATQ